MRARSRTRAAGPATLAAPRRSPSAARRLPIAAAGVVSLCLALAGCGGASGSHAHARRLSLERADLVRVVHALERVRGPVSAELAAAREAWPSISGGLPAVIAPSLSGRLARAGAAASRILAPAFMTQLEAPALRPRVYLTGPAAGAAGLFQSFSNLTGQGWTLTDAAIKGLAGASTANAASLRANARLYVSCIYDGHFDLAQIGKNVMRSYESLGGPNGFGGSLPEDEMTALASFYSDQLRLEPHSIYSLS